MTSLDAAGISFRAVGAVENISRTEFNHPHSLSFRLELSSGHRISAADGESLKDCEWNLLAIDSDKHGNTEVDSDGSIGTLGRHRNSCNITVAIGRLQFEQLLTSIHSGGMPCRISVHVKGLEYGIDPEGRETIWKRDSGSSLLELIRK